MFNYIGKGIKRFPYFQTFFVKTALRFSKELFIYFQINYVLLVFKAFKTDYDYAPLLLMHTSSLPVLA